MIIGRTRSNIRALIEDQYEILSQMIEDIADHYQKEAIEFEKRVESLANEDSGGDEDIRQSISRGFDELIDKKYALISEARKILFCSIFSYFETMLYGIIDYYKIPKGGTDQVKQLVEKIKEEFHNKYNEQIPDYGSTESIICDQYRILRNYFMHEKLKDVNDKEKLRFYALKEQGIYCYDWDKFEITSNNFLVVALNRINGFLVSIEEAYDTKTKELRCGKTRL